jgi:hypothetical protein
VKDGGEAVNMKLIAPELEEILKEILENQKEFKQILSGRQEQEQGSNPKPGPGVWVRRPVLTNMFQCGPKKIEQLVEEGKIEKDATSFRWPLYRLKAQ